MKYRITRHSSGAYVGAIDMPAECGSTCGQISAIAVGETKTEALAKAALVAERIASDPVIQQLIPPQAQAAIATAKTLATAARQGPKTLRRVWRGIRGRGKRKLAKILHAEAVGMLEVGGPFSRLRRMVRRKRKKRPAPPPERMDDQPEQPEESDDDQGGEDE